MLNPKWISPFVQEPVLSVIKALSFMAGALVKLS
jgi:hypothetical protein